MRDWKPKALWDEVRRTVRDWMERDDDEGEKAQDPSFMFHVLFTVPLLLGLYAMMTMMSRHA